jgi:hypothetical protein
MIAGSFVEIRSGNVPNTNLKSCHYTNEFCVKMNRRDSVCPSQINGDSLQNLRRETSKKFRKKERRLSEK